MLGPKRAGPPGVLSGWQDGLTEASVGSSEAVNGSAEAPGTLSFLSQALVGVGASISFGCPPGVTLALWGVFAASFAAG